MYRSLTALLSILVLLGGCAAAPREASRTSPLFAQDNLLAWCIVPYDKLARSPQDRIAMLKQLGFSQYAYDWRPAHLATFAEELRLAQEQNIRVNAVWMWIDGGQDAPGKLSAANQNMLDILQASGIRTRLWVGINGNFFDGLDEAAKLQRATGMLRFLRGHVPATVTGIGLYGHGDWFGEPDNQIRILQTLNDPQMGLVYNFHHGHAQVAHFSALMQKMAPWLWTVNLNGMGTPDQKILPIGAGTNEAAMLDTLKRSGFRGSIGILGHVEEEDVQVVLQRNLDGLRRLDKAN